MLIQGFIFTILLFIFQISIAKADPNCPAASQFQSLSFNVVEPYVENNTVTYDVYYDGYRDFDTNRPWFVLIGKIAANSASFAKKQASVLAKTTRLPINPDQIAFLDQGMWICTYPTSDPQVLLAAISPAFGSLSNTVS